MELTLDRDAIIQVVYNGLYTANAQAVSPENPLYVPSIEAARRYRSIARAEALLAEAERALPVAVSLK